MFDGPVGQRNLKFRFNGQSRLGYARKAEGNAADRDLRQKIAVGMSWLVLASEIRRGRNAELQTEKCKYLTFNPNLPPRMATLAVTAEV